MAQRAAEAPSFAYQVAPSAPAGTASGRVGFLAGLAAAVLVTAAAAGAWPMLDAERKGDEPQWLAVADAPALRGFSHETSTPRETSTLRETSTPREERPDALSERMSELRLRQERLTERQKRLARLIEAAERRDIVVRAEELRARRPDQPLLLARLDARAGAAPRPIPGAENALGNLASALPPAMRRAQELDLALAGLEWTQDAVLDALERAMEERLQRLAKVPAELGLSVPDAGVGGPLVELRGVESPLEPVDSIEVLHAVLEEVDEFERVVDALPIRSPLDVDLRVTSNYGLRKDPFLGRSAMHAGMDFAAANGTPIRASGSGKVRFAGWNGGYGRMVEIDHGNGHRTRYGHMSKIAVAKGEVVDAGAVIGAVGSSGRSTGPHLHYEVARDGKRRDPAPYLDAAELLGGET